MEHDRACLRKGMPASRAAGLDSQSIALAAACLMTSVSTVQKWEIGQKKPTGTALKLLHMVQDTRARPGSGRLKLIGSGIGDSHVASAFANTTQSGGIPGFLHETANANSSSVNS
jgi:hypothetical protein